MTAKVPKRAKLCALARGWKYALYFSTTGGDQQRTGFRAAIIIYA
jgi:hypothetical protein